MTNPPIHTIALTHEQATHWIDTPIRVWDTLPPGELKDSVFEMHTYLDTLIPIYENVVTDDDTNRTITKE